MDLCRAGLVTEQFCVVSLGLLPDFSILLSDYEGEVGDPSPMSLPRPEKALGDYYKEYFNRK